MLLARPMTCPLVFDTARHLIVDERYSRLSYSGGMWVTRLRILRRHRQRMFLEEAPAAGVLLLMSVVAYLVDRVAYTVQVSRLRIRRRTTRHRPGPKD